MSKRDSKVVITSADGRIYHLSRQDAAALAVRGIIPGKRKRGLVREMFAWHPRQSGKYGPLVLQLET